MAFRNRGTSAANSGASDAKPNGAGASGDSEVGDAGSANHEAKAFARSEAHHCPLGRGVQNQNEVTRN